MKLALIVFFVIILSPFLLWGGYNLFFGAYGSVADEDVISKVNATIIYVGDYYESNDYYPSEDEFNAFIEKQGGIPTPQYDSYNRDSETGQTASFGYRLPSRSDRKEAPGIRHSEWGLYRGHSVYFCGAQLSAAERCKMGREMEITAPEKEYEAPPSEFILSTGNIIRFQKQYVDPLNPKIFFPYIDISTVRYDPTYFKRLKILSDKATMSMALKAIKTGKTNIFYKTCSENKCLDAQLNVEVIEDQATNTPRYRDF